MLTTLQKVKETILITLLNIALPTVDIFTDLAATSKLYSGYLSHEDCDERNELEPFGSYQRSNSVYTWAEAKDKCINNSSAEGIYYTAHPRWATFLLVPFLINYVTTWVIWWSVDKRKAVSWIAPIFSVYPQVSKESRTNHKRGMRV